MNNKCPKCGSENISNRKTHNHVTYFFVCKDCKAHFPFVGKIKTNFDCITESPEKLAALRFENCDHCPFAADCCIMSTPENRIARKSEAEKCRKTNIAEFIFWLNSPAEES